MSDDDKKQPTVLVKKPDGTTVRVPLSQLNAFKKEQSVSVPTPAPTTPAPVKTSVEKKVVTEKKESPWVSPPEEKKVEPDTTGLLRRSAPRNDSEPARNDKPQWQKGDSNSLLEEKFETTRPDLPMLSQNRDGQVDAIIKKFNFKVSPDNQNRFRSVIQLRLKGIRDENRTKETLLRAVHEGGLGLLESQANQVLQAIQSNRTVQTAKLVEKKPVGKLMIEPQDLPQEYHEPAVPAKSTPFNSFVHDEIRKEEPVLKLKSQPVQKQIIQDIRPPMQETEEYGPVEEIKNFSLTDFRRLSDKASESARRLQQKFYNLKDESFLLYLQGKQAWKQSPLYQDYMQAVGASLARRQALSVVVGANKDGIQLEEIKSLVEMEKEL
ncbi:MAG: hypothetical protein ABIH87_01060 [bacterium]